MDPGETLRLWRSARANGERTLAREYRNYLRDWIGRGGFAPEGLTGRERRALGMKN